MSDTPITDDVDRIVQVLIANYKTGWINGSECGTRIKSEINKLRQLERENAALRKAIEECRDEHDHQVICWGSCDEPENAAYHQRWADHCRRALEGKDAQP